jgi:hypothetical protein
MAASEYIYDLSYATSYRLAAPKLSVEKLFHIKRLFAFKHEIDCASQFMGKDPQRLAFVLLLRKLGHIVFCLC